MPVDRHTTSNPGAREGQSENVFALRRFAVIVGDAEKRQRMRALNARLRGEHIPGADTSNDISPATDPDHPLYKTKFMRGGE